jgi:outer membrane lipoprotein-sorting protein
MSLRQRILASVGLSLLLLALYPSHTPYAISASAQAPVETVLPVSEMEERLKAIRMAHRALRSMSGEVRISLCMEGHTVNYESVFQFAKPNRANARSTVSGDLKELDSIPAEIQKKGEVLRSYTTTAVSDGTAQYIVYQPNRGRYFKQPPREGQANIASVLDHLPGGKAIINIYLKADKILPYDFETRMTHATVTETVREGIPVFVFNIKGSIARGADRGITRTRLIVGKDDNVIRELMVSDADVKLTGQHTEGSFVTKNLRLNPTLPPDTFQFIRPQDLKEAREGVQ